MGWRNSSEGRILNIQKCPIIRTGDRTCKVYGKFTIPLERTKLGLNNKQPRRSTQSLSKAFSSISCMGNSSLEGWDEYSIVQATLLKRPKRKGNEADF